MACGMVSPRSEPSSVNGRCRWKRGGNPDEYNDAVFQAVIHDMIDRANPVRLAFFVESLAVSMHVFDDTMVAGLAQMEGIQVGQDVCCLQFASHYMGHVTKHEVSRHCCTSQ
jgi:hypothetical protein